MLVAFECKLNANSTEIRLTMSHDTCHFSKLKLLSVYNIMALHIDYISISGIILFMHHCIIAEHGLIRHLMCLYRWNHLSVHECTYEINNPIWLVYMQSKCMQMAWFAAIFPALFLNTFWNRRRCMIIDSSTEFCNARFPLTMSLFSFSSGWLDGSKVFDDG